MLRCTAHFSRNGGFVSRSRQSFRSRPDVTPDGVGVPEAPPETFVINRTGAIRATFRPRQTGIAEQSLAATMLPWPRQAAR